MPVIYACEKAVWKEKKTHFNTNHMVTIIWEESALAKGQDDLAATFRATFRGEAKQVGQIHQQTQGARRPCSPGASRGTSARIGEADR